MTTANDSSPVLRARGVRLDDRGSRSGVTRRRRGPVRLLDGFELEMAEGERLWVVAGPGEGGREAGQVLSGQIAPTAGTVELDGVSILGLRGRKLAAARRRMAWVDGQAVPALDRKRTGVEIVAASAAEAAGVRKVTAEQLTIAERLLARVGLPADRGALRIDALNEDEQRLVDAARVLALRPRVIVHERGGGADSVADLLEGLRPEAGTAVVVVCQQLPEAVESGERVLVLCGGQTVEVLSAADLVHPLHPYTRTLRATREGPDSTVAGMDPAAPPRAWGGTEVGDHGCTFRGDCLWAKARCHEEVPRLRRPLGATHDVACHFPGEPPRNPLPAAQSDVVVLEGGTARGAADLRLSDEPTAREFAEG